MYSPVERLQGWVPRWWRGAGGAAGAALDAALLPAEVLFRSATRLRGAAYDHGLLRAAAASIPVISVGNLTVGGAGKTPFSAWMAGRLREMERRPALVLRGYAADEVEVHRELNPNVPVFAAARRIDGVHAAARAGCDIAVLDDAFQHRALQRDLDIVLISAEGWTDRRRLLPRGPWREEPAALARADLAIVTRKSASLERARAVRVEIGDLAGRVPVVVCSLEPSGIRSPAGEERSPGWLAGRRVLAVATLADPDSFHDQLLQLGASAELRAFPDHHEFSPAQVEELVGAARGRDIVVTRKEAVKLRPLLPAGLELHVLEQRVSVETGRAEIEGALRRVLGAVEQAPVRQFRPSGPDSS